MPGTDESLPTQQQHASDQDRMQDPSQTTAQSIDEITLSDSQIAAVTHVLTGAKETLAAWKDLPQTSRSASLIKALFLCKVISSSPSWFGLDSLTQSHTEMAESTRLLLQRVIDQRFCSTEEDAGRFWSTTIPFLLQCAMHCAQDINAIMADRLGQLRGEGSKVVTKSRLQCAEIVAGGFFCLFPEYGGAGPARPLFDFISVHKKHPNPASFFLCYFAQVAKEPLEELKSEKVSFTRKAVGDAQNLSECHLELCDVQCDAKGTIEDHHCLQADFANKFIGGGVLLGGNVQEEIRFMICPELCAAMPLSDVMAPHEAIEIVGAVQYAKYSGYGGSLKYAGPTDLAEEKKKFPLDRRNRRSIRIVAMDALPMPERTVQYGHAGMTRELTKATVAFAANDADGAEEERPLGVATGNWGCGVFGGDPQLKCLLQWIACSVNRRPRMVYCSFGDRRVEEMGQVVEVIKRKRFTVADLYRLLYSPEFQAAKPWRAGVFEFIKSQLAA